LGSAPADAPTNSPPPQLPARPQDYTDDKCMRGFTPLQHKRMEAMWQLHRAK
jgi:hypothetical protein